MRILRHLPHWLTGHGPCLQVVDCVPEAHPLRQWADTVPWAAVVVAVDQRFAQRVPRKTLRGRPPGATRVFLALARLNHALSCADEHICRRFRTALAVMYACGMTEVRAERAPGHCVLPEVLAQFRRRIDEALREA